MSLECRCAILTLFVGLLGAGMTQSIPVLMTIRARPGPH